MLSINMTETNSMIGQNKDLNPIDPGLYLVPTPIGNMRDITLRALDVLRVCDAVICEDSRVTGKLLSFYAIKDKKKIVYNDHATVETRDYIIGLLRDGKMLALVSDAGTPMVSDPGYKLVRDCLDMGLSVTALPGANAVLPALQLSALPTDHFVFGGFIPAKDKAVRDLLDHYKGYAETLVFYDTAKRIEKTLSVMCEIIPDRQIAVVREISKLYEESLRGKAQDILQRLQVKPIKGEIVLVVGGNDRAADGAVDIDGLILTALEAGQSVKELSAELATKTGLKKKDIYERALALK